MSRVGAFSMTAVLLGAAIGGGLVIAAFHFSTPGQCVPLVPIANLTISTPVMIINSPYLGAASGTLTTFTNISGHPYTITQATGSRNGSIAYLLQLLNWTVWTTHHVGTGSGSCHGVYSLSWVPTGTSVLNSSANYTNDSDSQQYIGGGSPPWPNGAPLGYVYFNDSVTEGTFEVSTCGGSAIHLQARSTYLDLRIPFAFQGVWHTQDVSFRALTNYTYTFPTNSGVWSVDALNLPGGPGGGWAFSYLRGCP